MTSRQKKKDAGTHGQASLWLRSHDPFSQLKEAMDALFSSDMPALARPGRSNGGRTLAMAAKRDVSETGDAIELVLDVPGIDRKDIDISLTASRVGIAGKRDEKKDAKGRNDHRMERTYGAFERQVPLPCDADAEKASATLDKGVLLITLPKSDTARLTAKKITIRAD